MKKELILLGGGTLAIGMVLFFSVSLYQEGAPTNERTPRENDQTSFPTTTGNIIAGEGTKNAASNTQSAGEKGGTYTISPPPNDERVYCTPESRLIEECEPNDHPVCGWFDENQVTCDDEDPCVRSTFPNECEACITPPILYWTNDECPIHR